MRGRGRGNASGDEARGLRTLLEDLRAETGADSAWSSSLSKTTGAAVGLTGVVGRTGAEPEVGGGELPEGRSVDAPRFTAGSKNSLRTASGGAGRFDMETMG